MRRIFLCSALALSACASTGAATGSKGVMFDMSPQEVLAGIRSTDTIVSTNDNEIVSEGPWDTLPDIRRKTFTFSNGKLQCVSYVHIRGDNRLANINPALCK